MRKAATSWPWAQRRAGYEGDHSKPASRSRGYARGRSAGDGRACGRRVHGSLVGGYRHRSWVSLVSLGLRAGRWWPSPSRSYSLWCSWRWSSLGSTFSESRWALSSSHSLAGRRRHDHGRDNGHAAGPRDDKEHAATFAYTSTAFPMLTGTLVTVAGLFRSGSRAAPRRVYLLDLRRRCYRPDCILVVAWSLLPCSGLDPQEDKGRARGGAGRIMRAFRASWCWPCGHAGSRSSSRSACSQRRCMGCASFRSNSSRRLTGPSCSWICSCLRTLRSTQQGCLGLAGQAPQGR